MSTQIETTMLGPQDSGGLLDVAEPRLGIPLQLFGFAFDCPS